MTLPAIIWATITSTSAGERLIPVKDAIGRAYAAFERCV